MSSSESCIVPRRVVPLLNVVRDALVLYGYTMTDDLAELLTDDVELLIVLQRLSFAALVPGNASRSWSLNRDR